MARCKRCEFRKLMRGRDFAKVVILDHALADCGIYRVYVIPQDLDLVAFSEWPHRQKSKFWLANLTELPGRCTCPELQTIDRPIGVPLFPKNSKRMLGLFQHPRY